MRAAIETIVVERVQDAFWQAAKILSDGHATDLQSLNIARVIELADLILRERAREVE